MRSDPAVAVELSLNRAVFRRKSGGVMYRVSALEQDDGE